LLKAFLYGFLILILGIVLLFYRYDWYLLTGPSMEPTLYDGDIILVDTQDHSFRRGDVIMFEHQESETIFVKRVAGVAGDRIEGKQGRILVNGHLFAQSPVRSRATDDFGPITVPKGHLFVLGDRLTDSLDSRELGPVPVGSVIGRAEIVVYPIRHVQLITGEGQK